MAQPTPYERKYNFTDWQTVNPTKPLPARELDAELNAVELTVGQIRSNLRLIQRDDGKLANQSVTPESLSAGTLALIAQAEYRPRGDWSRGTVYAVGDVVNYNLATYVCLAPHTAETAFLTDQNAGRWLLIANGALTGEANAVDLFEGNGSTKVFALSLTYQGSNSAAVFVSGVAQVPGQDFTINGDQITFVVPPPPPPSPGIKNVMVRGSSVAAQLAVAAAKQAEAQAAIEADASAASAAAAAASAATAQAAATNPNVVAVGTNIASVNTVAGAIANVNAVASNATNINTVAGSNASVTTVAGAIANVNAVASNATNINTVAGISANVTTVAGISASVSSVAGNTANVNAVASNATNINAVAGNATNINTVASNTSNINTVAGSNANVTTVATNIASVNTNAANIVAIQNASANANTVLGALNQVSDGVVVMKRAGPDYPSGSTPGIELPSTPLKPNTLKVYADGVLLREGYEYHRPAANFVSVFPPLKPSWVLVSYDIGRPFAELDAAVSDAKAAEAAAAASAAAASVSAKDAAAAKTAAAAAQEAAEAAQLAAKQARDQAFSNSDMYPDIATALSLTPNGGYFGIPSGGNTYVTLYRNDSGSATLINSLYGASKVDAIEEAQVVTTFIQAAAISQLQARLAPSIVFPD